MKERIFKKGIKKRLCSVVLALAMIISLLPVNSMKVYAADEPILVETITVTGNWTYGDKFYVGGEYVPGASGLVVVNYNGYSTVRVCNNHDLKISKLIFNFTEDITSKKLTSSDFTIEVDNSPIAGASVTIDGTRVIASNINSTKTVTLKNKITEWVWVTSVEIYVDPHTCSESEVTEENKKAGQDATCTEDGWNPYWICSCGKVYAPNVFSKSYDSESAWKTGDGKIAALGHTWGYNADGATLTATCGRDSSHTATLTITASNMTYNSSPYTVHLLEVLLHGQELVSQFQASSM